MPENNNYSRSFDVDGTIPLTTVCSRSRSWYQLPAVELDWKLDASNMVTTALMGDWTVLVKQENLENTDNSTGHWPQYVGYPESSCFMTGIPCGLPTFVALFVDTSRTSFICLFFYPCLPDFFSSFHFFGVRASSFLLCLLVDFIFCYGFFFKSSGGWVKIKRKPPHFHVSDTCVSI